MGDCASRPNYLEIESHVKYVSSVNDAFFHEPVLLPSSERSLLFTGLDKSLADSQQAAESYLYSLNSQMMKVTQRLNAEDAKTKVKLVLEVRKGIDMYPVGGTKAKGVYVIMRTAPCLKEAQSTVSDMYIPKWYSLAFFLFDQSEALESVTLSVYCKSVSGEDTLFGTVALDMRLCTDVTETRWHPIAMSDLLSPLRIKPQLELRTWLLRNHYTFWYQSKETLEREIEEVKAALARSRTGLAL